MKADKAFDINLYKPNLIKVVSNNITPYPSGGGYKNITETLQLDHTKRCVTFTPKLPKLYRVNTNVLNNLSIELVNEHNLPINFVAGVPSIVKIRITNMDTIGNNFYIQASNTDSKDIFIENTCSSFRSRLPKEITLQEG